MIYLFDANVLITASNTYYPVDRVPEYWSWVTHHAKIGRIKMPIEIVDEILAGHKDDDPLKSWLRDNKNRLTLDEAVNVSLIQRVVSEGYAPNLTEDELGQTGRDPFLVAYALAKPGRCVVTTEVSRPKSKRQNRRIPDVCRTFDVSCCGPFEVYRDLGFRTSWENPKISAV